MSDPVHCFKKGNSSLYKSTKKGDAAESHSTRSIIKYEVIGGEEVECYLSLRQLFDVWKARSAAHHQYGLRYDRKFTEKHFFPDAASRMKVSHAAQNLSGTMSSWVRDDIKNNGRTYNTALMMYCDKWNEYFDIMNGKLGPVTSGDDSKPSTLTRFARWFEDWHEDLKTRGFPSKADLEAAFISQHCFFDMRLAVHGFVWCCKFYARPSQPAWGQLIFPQSCNQDIAEHHFKNIRSANGANRNPSSAAAQNSAQNSA